MMGEEDTSLFGDERRLAVTRTRGESKDRLIESEQGLEEEMMIEILWGQNNEESTSSRRQENSFLFT